MSTEQTPIDKAIAAMEEAKDRIDNIIVGLEDSGVHESELFDVDGDINDAPAPFPVEDVMEVYVDHNNECPSRYHDESWSDYDKRSQEDFRARILAKFGTP